MVSVPGKRKTDREGGEELLLEVGYPGYSMHLAYPLVTLRNGGELKWRYLKPFTQYLKSFCYRMWH